MELKIEGLEKIELEVEDLIDIINVEKAMGKACALVEGEARKKAPKKTGALRRHMDSKVEYEGNTLVGTVFNPLEYAPYVEYGTGLFAETQGRQTPWAYEDPKTGETIWTAGQHPQPYLRPALYENRDKIIKILKEGIKK